MKIITRTTGISLNTTFWKSAHVKLALKSPTRKLQVHLSWNILKKLIFTTKIYSESSALVSILNVNSLNSMRMVEVDTLIFCWVKIHSIANRWNRNSKTNSFFLCSVNSSRGISLWFTFCLHSFLLAFLQQTIGGWIKWYSMIAPQPAIEASNIYVFVLIPRATLKLDLEREAYSSESFFRGKCFQAPAAKDSKAFISEASINIFTFGDLKSSPFPQKKHFRYLFIDRFRWDLPLLCALPLFQIYTRGFVLIAEFFHTFAARSDKPERKSSVKFNGATW